MNDASHWERHPWLMGGTGLFGGVSVCGWVNGAHMPGVVVQRLGEGLLNDGLVIIKGVKNVH
jgi:hypothetical protein